MAAYTLTAERDGTKRATTFDVADHDPSYPSLDADFRATSEAIFVILNLAADDDLWAKGRIVLKNAAGEVLHEMEEKA